MQQKIIEIIEFLISKLDNSDDIKLSDLDLLSQTLLDKGYSEKDIETAFEWIVESINPTKLYNSEKSGYSDAAENLRVLTPNEKRYFSLEAHSYLVQLQLLGIAGAIQIEQIIDRSIMLGLAQIELDDVKSISKNILIDKENNKFSPDLNYHPGTESVS